MKIGVVKETKPGERRVALVPESVKKLSAKRCEIVVESGAGQQAGFLDAAYTQVGASVVASAKDVLAAADAVVKVNAPQDGEIDAMSPDGALVALMFPLTNLAIVERLRDRRLTGVALDRIPRITLAQSMDVLSSQSTVAGYRAVLVAAEALPKLFPLMMTAAGRIDAARVMVLGAGVAGLQAIGTARRLGAIVEAYDVRAVVREQVESLGATFIDIGMAEDAEAAGGYAKEVSEDTQKRAEQVIGEHLRETNVCITTALIPGRPAPRLVTAEMAKQMKPGSVIVDLAAEQGGNCELTVPGETVVVDGIAIKGPLNMPSDAPFDASQMFSRNVEKLLLYLLKDGNLDFDFEKEIVRGCVFTRAGKVVDPKVAELLSN